MSYTVRQMDIYFKNVISLIRKSVEKLLARNYNYKMPNFQQQFPTISCDHGHKHYHKVIRVMKQDGGLTFR